MVPIITWAPPHLSAQTEHGTITAAVFEQTQICESANLRFKKEIVAEAAGRSTHSELLPLTQCGSLHTAVGQVLILQLSRSLQTGPELKPKHKHLFLPLAQDILSMGTSITSSPQYTYSFIFSCSCLHSSMTKKNPNSLH